MPAAVFAVEAALVDLERGAWGGLSATEAAVAEVIRQAAGRLAEFLARITLDGVTVEGSMGQLRPHPLLDKEHAARRQISEQLLLLERTVTSRSKLERLNALSRESKRSDSK